MQTTEMTEKLISQKTIIEAIEIFFGINPGTRIIPKRVTNSCYRVNWYTPNTIIKSAFIKVEETEDGIIITDLTLRDIPKYANQN